MNQLDALLYQREDLNRQLINALKTNHPRWQEIIGALARADAMLAQLFDLTPFTEGSHMLQPTAESVTRGCDACKKIISPGMRHYFDSKTRQRYHVACKPADADVPTNSPAQSPKTQSHEGRRRYRQIARFHCSTPIQHPASRHNGVEPGVMTNDKGQ